jgi:hypothetical protein
MKPKKKSAQLDRIKKGIKKILDTPKGSRIMSPDYGSGLKWLLAAQKGMTSLPVCPKCLKKNRVNVVFAEKFRGKKFKLSCCCGLCKKEFDDYQVQQLAKD